MGLLMDFYAGDAQEIGGAFTAGDFDALNSRAIAHADFSLHLSPTDLDILSETAFEMMGRVPTGLLDSLEENVGGDGAESSADTVTEAWVTGMAAFPNDRVPELAQRWLRAVAEDRGDSDDAVTPDALQAVRELISLCRLAGREKVAVVHTWSL